VFAFYAYIKPDEYRMTRKTGHSSMQLVDFRSIDKELLSELEWQQEYITEEAMLVDAGFQLWKRGYRYTSSARPLPPIFVENLEDNYRFIRLYFGARWAWYILWLRWQEGNDRKKEWAAFRAVKDVPKIIWETPVSPSKELPKKGIFAPRVSVVITSLNRHAYLAQIVNDLDNQELPPWEILIVDQSPIAWVPPDSAPSVRVIRTPGKLGQWTGRNRALEEVRGEYIAFLDDDVRIEKNWLQEHINVLVDWSADISTGVYVAENELIPLNQQYPHYASQWNANNSLMAKEVLSKLGLLPTEFDGTRWGDHYYGCLAYQTGFIMVSNPYAAAIDRRAPSGGLREGEESSFSAYQILGGRALLSRGVLLFFHTYFDQLALFRWVRTKLPWQGKSGWLLWVRIGWYALRFPRFRKRIITQWESLSVKETAQ